MLTPRQESVLRKVVEAYLVGGAPVASRTIAADPELDCGPSTIRGELAMLEERGLLAHPHTSAGRVPTDAGHRYVVDRLLATGAPRAKVHGLEISLIRNEVDEAMRLTTQALSQVTDLLAVVSAPSLATATIRHIEVLALQPRVVMVVVITSTGSVSKLLATYEEPVDPGLVTWANEYLGERLEGLGLGARMLGGRLSDPSLGVRERLFVERLRPAFGGLAHETEDTIYVDGTARLFSEQQLHDIDQIAEVMGVLERRRSLLSVLRAALAEPDVYVRIGSENELPALRPLALVAASYGLAARRLGTVSVIGPVRMDYERAIASVREAAHELSRFVEHAFNES
ncbi:MAG TPA: heat-inducible transcriptional repressor HrcA [Solirubrobacteraceae bacterium]|jgi:heat-inducible transcriptional repressor|nr:heat-inducible transcriptional repressor HrcA [Solirubrobacteraceae bacterium]